MGYMDDAWVDAMDVSMNNFKRLARESVSSAVEQLKKEAWNNGGVEMEVCKEELESFMLDNWILYSSQTVEKCHRLVMQYRAFSHSKACFRVMYDDVILYKGTEMDEAVEVHNKRIKFRR